MVPEYETGFWTTKSQGEVWAEPVRTARGGAFSTEKPENRGGVFRLPSIRASEDKSSRKIDETRLQVHERVPPVSMEAF